MRTDPSAVPLSRPENHRLRLSPRRAYLQPVTNVSNRSTSGGVGVSQTGERVAGPDLRWPVAALVVTALALAVNSALGPLLTGTVSYPFSETIVNQTVGLDAVSLVVVAPWCLLAALALVVGHRAAPALALAPAAYTAYMFVQWVVGPAYLSYRPVVLFHLGVFVLSGWLLSWSWRRLRSAPLPAMTPARRRRAAWGLAGLAAFVVFRYVPLVAGALSGGPLPAEAAADPAMYWTIVWLDLGVVVPATVATAAGLRRGREWAERAAYGVVGWFVLVPVSVVAMSVAMLAAGDPHASVATLAVLGTAAVLFAVFAAWLYRPLFGGGGYETVASGGVGG
jgi:hypothetical protein